jgi:hypothetical protein
MSPGIYSLLLRLPLLWGAASIAAGCTLSASQSENYRVQELRNPTTGATVLCGMGLDGPPHPTEAVVTAFNTCISDHMAAGFVKVDRSTTK